jgi:hypothetical protein
MELVEAAKKSLERPEHFIYYGDLYEEDGWGRAFGHHRDSDPLDESNWQVISEDLKERFPDDIEEESSNHFLVGWVETLRIRVLKNPHRGITEENITDAFKAAIEWKEKLESYPVADEEHYSNLEHEEFTEYISNVTHSTWYEAVEDTIREWDDVPDDFEEYVIRHLYDNSISRVDEVSDNDLNEAADAYLEENPLPWYIRFWRNTKNLLTGS